MMARADDRGGEEQGDRTQMGSPQRLKSDGSLALVRASWQGMRAIGTFLLAMVPAEQFCHLINEDTGAGYQQNICATGELLETKDILLI
jgi:hypothetical protein